jgi:hypothetical protein
LTILMEATSAGVERSEAENMAVTAGFFWTVTVFLFFRMLAFFSSSYFLSFVCLDFLQESLFFNPCMCPAFIGMSHIYSVWDLTQNTKNKK